MATLVVRNEADARRALYALQRADGEVPMSALRFEGWPRVVISVPEGIDLVRSSQAICTIRDLVERHFCLLTYGTTDRRRLTDRDKAEIRLGVEYQKRNTRLVIDFSKPATATARAVLLRAATKECPSDENVEAAQRSCEPQTESWPRTAREAALAVVGRLRPSQLTALGLAAIIVAGIAWTNTMSWKESLSHALAMKKETNEYQLKLAELDRATIVRGDGEKAILTENAQRAWERELEEHNRLANTLPSQGLEAPLLTLVVADVEGARPALLDLAPITGSIDVNGFTLDASTARAAAKAVRKATKPTPIKEGWTALVRRA